MTEHRKLTIKQWTIDDRPREKMMKYGRQALSDSELLAIIIGSGNLKETAVELSRRILQHFNNNIEELNSASIDKLKNGFDGIGEAKAINILAALELGRRSKVAVADEKPRIVSSSDVWNLVGKSLPQYDVEVFWIIFLNNANKVIDKSMISKGGIDSTVVDIRVIFRLAVEKMATSMVLIHNHPSGNLTPSREDINLTTRIVKGAEIMNVKVLDHLIISKEDYYSFADNGLL